MGTGINSVHNYYGRLPARSKHRHGEVVPPFQGVSRDLIPEEFGDTRQKTFKERAISFATNGQDGT